MISWFMDRYYLLMIAGLSAVLLAATAQQQTEVSYTHDIECTRRFFFQGQSPPFVELVPCPADPMLCDRVELLKDGTRVEGCPGPFVVTTIALPNAVCGQPYLAWFDAVDGVPPYSWTLAGTNADGSLSSLPAGLTLNPDGSITGTVPLSDPECQTGSGLVAVNLRTTVFGSN